MDLSTIPESQRRVTFQEVETAGKAAGLDGKELSQFTDKLRRLPAPDELEAEVARFYGQTITRFEAEDKR
jgi:hypothetical protein